MSSFWRTVGAQVTVNRMLSFESVKQRLGREQPLSFLEFNYMLLQAYDFLELYRREGVELQLGGSDQWGNIAERSVPPRVISESQSIGSSSGLCRAASTPSTWPSESSVRERRRAHAPRRAGQGDWPHAPRCCRPPTGRKMGKTAAGAVWLSPDKLSPFDYWQFWRNSADADVIRFMKLFTELELSEIEEMEGQFATETARRTSIRSNEDWPTSALLSCTARSAYRRSTRRRTRCSRTRAGTWPICLASRSQRTPSPWSTP